MATQTAHHVLQHRARLERIRDRVEAGHRSALPANAARKPRRAARRRRNRR